MNKNYYNFKSYRKIAGLTQEDVAFSVGLTQSCISKIERNAYKYSDDIALKLIVFYKSIGVLKNCDPKVEK